jgi:hypothetical protein
MLALAKIILFCGDKASPSWPSNPVMLKLLAIEKLFFAIVRG